MRDKCITRRSMMITALMAISMAACSKAADDKPAPIQELPQDETPLEDVTAKPTIYSTNDGLPAWAVLADIIPKGAPEGVCMAMSAPSKPRKTDKGRLVASDDGAVHVCIYTTTTNEGETFGQRVDKWASQAKSAIVDAIDNVISVNRITVEDARTLSVHGWPTVRSTLEAECIPDDPETPNFTLAVSVSVMDTGPRMAMAVVTCASEKTEEMGSLAKAKDPDDYEDYDDEDENEDDAYANTRTSSDDDDDNDEQYEYTSAKKDKDEEEAVSALSLWSSAIEESLCMWSVETKQPWNGKNEVKPPSPE